MTDLEIWLLSGACLLSGFILGVVVSAVSLASVPEESRYYAKTSQSSSPTDEDEV